MSSINKAPPPSSDMECSTEESGWTTYFEDFSNNVNDENKCDESMSSVVAGSSLVSDAASLDARKLADNNSEGTEEFSVNKYGSRSSFKKRKKTKAALVVEDMLEDTASSVPVNSHNVLYENQLDKPKQKEEVDLSQVKGSSSGERDGRKGLSGFNGTDSDCTELKKKGLCLVPFSMVVDYLG